MLNQQRVRYVKEASGAKSTTESFKYKNRDCDTSQNESLTSSSHNMKPLILVKEPYNQQFATNIPLRKLCTPQKVQHIDRRVVERTYSSVRTSNYVKRSSVAPEKKSEYKSVVLEKKQIKIPHIATPSTNVIEERFDDDPTQGQGCEVVSQKRRKSITFFELSGASDKEQSAPELEQYPQSELVKRRAQNLKVIINGQFEEREMHIDVSQIPNEWKLNQIAHLLNDLYKQEFNQYFKNPVLSMLNGRYLTKKLDQESNKLELILMCLKGQLKEQLIILQGP